MSRTEGHGKAHAEVRGTRAGAYSFGMMVGSDGSTLTAELTVFFTELTVRDVCLANFLTTSVGFRGASTPRRYGLDPPSIILLLPTTPSESQQ